MQMYIRAFCDRSAAKSGEPIPFVASTAGIARDGLVIEADAWQLDNYQRSPVVLWSHDYLGTRPPIGRAEDVRVADGKLLCNIRFDTADPFAADIERKYREGFLNAVSVGWDTVEMAVSQQGNEPPRVTKAELLDISAVNVPGDPNALMERQKRALTAQALDLLTIVGPDDLPDPLFAATKQRAETTARATWPETAAAMARVFAPFAQRPDAERDAEYKRIARDYARHGKTPPEFLTQAEVDALSIDDIRAHFLEGEPELCAGAFAAMGSRAGAVLSKRNRDDLAQAAGLIQGVIERAQKEEEQQQASDEERAAEAIARAVADGLTRLRG